MGRSSRDLSIGPLEKLRLRLLGKHFCTCPREYTRREIRLGHMELGDFGFPLHNGHTVRSEKYVGYFCSLRRGENAYSTRLIKPGQSPYAAHIAKRASNTSTDRSVSAMLHGMISSA